MVVVVFIVGVRLENSLEVEHLALISRSIRLAADPARATPSFVACLESYLGKLARRFRGLFGVPLAAASPAKVRLADNKWRFGIRLRRASRLCIVSAAQKSGADETG